MKVGLKLFWWWINWKSNYGWINLKSKKRVWNLWLITPKHKVIISKFNILHLKWKKLGIAPSFYLVLSEEYSKPTQTSKKERLAKLVDGWIPLTVFAKSFLLDVWLGSEYVSHYPGTFSIIVNWNYHFESSKHLSNVISDHQANTVGKDMDPVTSLKPN